MKFVPPSGKAFRVLLLHLYRPRWLSNLRFGFRFCVHPNLRCTLKALGLPIARLVRFDILNYSLLLLSCDVLEVSGEVFFWRARFERCKFYSFNDASSQELLLTFQLHFPAFSHVPVLVCCTPFAPFPAPTPDLEPCKSPTQSPRRQGNSRPFSGE